MSKGLKILQIGLDNWSHQYEIPENMDWYFVCPRSSKALRKMIEIDTISRFQAVLIEDGNSLTDVLSLPIFSNLMVFFIIRILRRQIPFF